MSVINKMLRDLDQRHGSSVGKADPLRWSTASVDPLPELRRRASVRRWAMVLLPITALMAGALVWWSFQPQFSFASVVGSFVTHPPSPVVAPVPAPVVSAPAVDAPLAAASEPMAPPVAQAPDISALETPPANNPIAEVQTEAVRLVPSVVLKSVPPTAATDAAAPKSKAEPRSLPAGPSLAAAPATAPAPTLVPKSASPAPDAGALAARQQQAGREALAQTQALWASGARETAIANLQEAVAGIERGAQGSQAASSTLVPMVRELARMQLAEGKAAAAWELLNRQELLLANQPELWALRANAAQRLGRHQDSVLAYTTALQSRPSEQRWLLGAAVSLAALGQTNAAAEMADKARAAGPVSREVLTYLRQQGVPLADRP